MAVPVARVHLKVAHTALPELLPTPPKYKMLPLLQTLPCPCAATILPKPLSKPSRDDSDGRWDARKTKPADAEHSVNSVVRSNAGHGSSRRKNVTSPPPKPSRADSMERWDAHKEAASPASSSSSSATSGLKKRCPPQAEQLVDGESSSTGSNDIDDTEEEILWKPRAMYAGPGFVVAAPDPTMFPMPTPFFVPVA